MHVSNPRRRTRTFGFTLIEIVIAMLIVAVLASVALSSYSGYMARARRADARTQLLQVSQFMQTFYSANDSFLQDRAANAVLSQIPAALLQSPADSTKIYSLSIPSATLSDSGFEIRMTPLSGGVLSTDQCGAFTLTSTGVRGVLVGSTVGNTALRDLCWR